MGDKQYKLKLTLADGSEVDAGSFTVPAGENGHTPYIQDGSWYINGVGTGVKAVGANGTSVTVSSVSESTEDGGSNVITFSDGKTLTIKNGSGGKAGDSVTVKSVSESAASGGSNIVTFSDGKTLSVKNGANGKDGYTPVKGTDYFTEADKADIVQAVLESMGAAVYGVMDENNNIDLEGDLVDGTYTIRYRYKDGTYSDAITVVVGDVPAEATNLIKESVDANGDPFVGTNGEDGYKDGVKISVSTGNEATAAGYQTTGFIPIALGEVLYFKGVITEKSGTNTNYVIYDSAKTKIAGGNWYLGPFQGGVSGEVVSAAMTEAVLKPTLGSITADAAYIRFSAKLTANSIVSKQPLI